MKVLIVDDSTINLKVEQKVLEKLECEVDTALSGKECLEILENSTYDIIFMDIMMPGMDGVETFKRIREKGITTPVITLTADDSLGAREKYLEVGFDAYLSKPINIEAIKDTIDNIKQRK